MSDTPKIKTLRDVMPPEFMGCEYDRTYSRKWADVEVAQEFEGFKQRWPGAAKNVHSWVVLKNNKAVGWNENPSHGWSFPHIEYKAPTASAAKKGESQ